MNLEYLEFLKEQFETNQLNRLPEQYGGGRIFSDPLVGVLVNNTLADNDGSGINLSSGWPAVLTLTNNLDWLA